MRSHDAGRHAAVRAWQVQLHLGPDVGRPVAAQRDPAARDVFYDDWHFCSPRWPQHSRGAVPRHALIVPAIRLLRGGHRGQELCHLIVHRVGIPPDVDGTLKHLGARCVGLLRDRRDLLHSPRGVLRRSRNRLHAGGDFARRSGLLLDSGGNCGRHLVHLTDRRAHFAHRGHRLAGGGAYCGDLHGDLVGRLCGLGRKRLHLAGHHGEAFAGFAGARCLDRGVQREQIGAAGDIRDQLDHVTDPIRRRRHAADLRVSGIGPLHGRARRLVGTPHLLADLVDTGRHLLRGGGYGTEVGCRRRRTIGCARGAVARAMRGVRHPLRGQSHGLRGTPEARHHAGRRSAEVLRMPIHRSLATCLQRMLLVRRCLQAARLQSILLEHHQGLRHLAHFVLAVGGRDLRRHIAARQPTHRSGHLP